VAVVLSTVIPAGASAQICTDTSERVSNVVLVPSHSLPGAQLVDAVPLANESTGLNSDRLRLNDQKTFWWGLAAGQLAPVEDINVALEEGTEVCKDGTCVTDVASIQSPSIRVDEWLNPGSGNCVAFVSVDVDTATYVTYTRHKAKGRLKGEVRWMSGWVPPDSVASGLPAVEKGNLNDIRQPLPASAKQSTAVVVEISRGASDQLFFLSQPEAAFPGEPVLTAKQVLGQICSTQNKLCQCVNPSRFLRFSCYTQAQRLDFSELEIAAGAKP